MFSSSAAGGAGGGGDTGGRWRHWDSPQCSPAPFSSKDPSTSGGPSRPFGGECDRACGVLLAFNMLALGAALQERHTSKREVLEELVWKNKY